jgi:hypothetical protein
MHTHTHTRTHTPITNTPHTLSKHKTKHNKTNRTPGELIVKRKLRYLPIVNPEQQLMLSVLSQLDILGAI